MEWTSDKVRKTFISFFEEREHLYVPSSPSFPQNDPTILFANAGMNQFKSIFLGTVNPSSPQAQWKRAANSQKCIRAGGKHNDLDEVGTDYTHHTFFEMLGNWSFGDYFYRESIDWCHELLFNVYGIDKKKVYVTYFGGDASAGLAEDTDTKQYWLKYFPENHIIPKGMEDNFWEMGDTGPCGGCTELHYDLKYETRDPNEVVTDDSEGVVEICNLVFMTYNREPSGKLTPLPFKHVDTGMGFERLCSVLQNKKSNYDTDIFSDIIDEVQRITKAEPYTGKVGDEDVGKKDTAYRIISDHIRTLVVALSDGAVPGSDGRSYVLRRILRRAVRAGKEFLKAEDGFFHQLVDIVVKKLGFFPEIASNAEKVKEIIRKEEKLFTLTLSTGIKQFNRLVKNKKSGDTLNKAETYQLCVSYGFPLDLVQIMATELGINVDVAGYNNLMEDQKKREKELSAAKKGKGAFKLSPKAISILQEQKLEATVDSFKYKLEDLEGPKIVAIWQGNQETGSFKTTVEKGDCAIILDKTNFYAESGGQMFDSGFLTSSTGVIFLVKEVQIFAGYIMHFGELQPGSFSVGETVSCSVNYEARIPITRNHSSTHLLNFALRKVLGDSNQRGSLVTADKLRFDFSSGKNLNAEQIKQVDIIVNEFIKDELIVYTQETPIAQAKSISGVRAMFSEAYPDPVRVVSIGADIDEALKNPEDAKWQNYAIEFCGGTHVANTKEVEIFCITSEEGVGNGERRIQAVTGHEARKAVEEGERLNEKVLELLQVEDRKLQSEYQPLKIEIDSAVIPYSKKLEIRAFCTKNIESKIAVVAKELIKKKQQDGENLNASIISELKTNPEQKVVVRLFLEAEGDNQAMSKAAVALLKTCTDELKRDVAVLLLSVDPKSKQLIIQANVSAELIKKGLKGNEWINQSIPGGKCGSPKADVAQGKSPIVDNLEASVTSSLNWAIEKLKQ